MGLGLYLSRLILDRDLVFKSQAQDSISQQWNNSVKLPLSAWINKALGWSNVRSNGFIAWPWTRQIWFNTCSPVFEQSSRSITWQNEISHGLPSKEQQMSPPKTLSTLGCTSSFLRTYSIVLSKLKSSGISVVRVTIAKTRENKDGIGPSKRQSNSTTKIVDPRTSVAEYRSLLSYFTKWLTKSRPLEEAPLRMSSHDWPGYL